MANNRLPFGLCKKYGIELPKDATPKDAWAALDKIPADEFKKPLMIPLDFFAKTETTQTRTYNSKKRPELPKEAYGFARLETEHHKDHAEEMGYKNQKEYEKAAIDFWNKGNGDVYYSNARNSFIKYNMRTTEFIVVSGDGTIHTFMYIKPIKFKTIARWEKLEKQENI